MHRIYLSSPMRDATPWRSCHIKASPELCLEETLSQNEDAVQEETPSEETASNPEEVEQSTDAPAEENGSEEEVEAVGESLSKNEVKSQLFFVRMATAR